MLKKSLLLFSIILIFSCSNGRKAVTAERSEVIDVKAKNIVTLNTAFEELVEKNKINTLGVAVIKKSQCCME